MIGPVIANAKEFVCWSEGGGNEEEEEEEGGGSVSSLFKVRCYEDVVIVDV